MGLYGVGWRGVKEHGFGFFCKIGRPALDGVQQPKPCETIHLHWRRQDGVGVGCRGMVHLGFDKIGRLDLTRV